METEREPASGLSIGAELLKRYSFESSADRLGPDCPFTHVQLYIPGLANRLCQRKFRRFGANAQFRPGAYAIGCSNISLGHRVVIRPQTMLFADPDKDGSTIEIEDDVLIGSGVHIYVGNHEFRDTNVPIIDQGRQQSQSVKVHRGCWIGANSILLPGCSVGENAVVGAGSVVTKPVEPGTVVAGNPARLIRNLAATNET